MSVAATEFDRTMSRPRQLDVVLNRYLRHEGRITMRRYDETRRCYDRVYLKRVNTVCRDQRIPQAYLPVLVRLFLWREAPNAARRLAEHGWSQHRTPEAAYLLGWTRYRVGDLAGAAKILRTLLRGRGRKCPAGLRDFARAFLAWVSLDSSGDPEAAQRYFGQDRRLKQALRRRLRDAARRPLPKARERALQVFRYPVFRNGHFKPDEVVGLWRVAGRFFLLPRHAAVRIL